MAAFTERILGRTGLKVGRLGLAASYGAPAQAFEEAFEHGCNYFYLGSGRHRAGMRRAIRNLCRQGQRDRLVIAIQSYARFGFFMEWYLRRNLRAMEIEQADILILGAHNRRPLVGLVARALEIKTKVSVAFWPCPGTNASCFRQWPPRGRLIRFTSGIMPPIAGLKKKYFPIFRAINGRESYPIPQQAGGSC
jgi:hypothetical protein